ncbi:MAG: HD domain-containing protein [Deltaproteobacteria bacterium]|jgi:HD-GYP domain-containing protein (c-di-GMP phosphodiesterase class II)|nr:HD domain-containing protein [Deltaproteobacteria bacterium]
MGETEKAVRKTSAGEIVLISMFRLLQVVKIHQANNRLFSEMVNDFNGALAGVWKTGKPVSFTLYRGRFFLNDERIAYSPTVWATSVKLSEFFQERGLSGLRFEPKDNLTGDEIVDMINTLHQAKRHPDPFKWLQENLAKPDGWPVVPTRTDDGFASGPDGLPAADGEPQGASRGEGETNLQAKLVYSQALTVLRNIVTRLTTGKKASIQKGKRVVQELIDLMLEDWGSFLALSTVRDHGDQIYTHSANVTILSLALGHSLGYSKKSLEQLGLIAFLHDLGKAGDFLATAEKSDALDGRDLAMVQNLTLGSIARIIRLNASYGLKLSMLQPVGEHHLGVNLSGWPLTNRTRPLSLSGRVLAIADQYDAMVSHRPYRPEPLSPSSALRELIANSSGRLDPIVVRIFAQMMGPWPVGSLLVLDTGELAVTAAHNQADFFPSAVLLATTAEGTLAKGPLVDLTESDEGGGKLRRRIVDCLNPAIYSIQPSDFLI